MGELALQGLKRDLRQHLAKEDDVGAQRARAARAVGRAGEGRVAVDGLLVAAQRAAQAMRALACLRCRLLARA